MTLLDFIESALLGLVIVGVAYIVGGIIFAIIAVIKLHKHGRG